MSEDVSQVGSQFTEDRRYWISLLVPQIVPFLGLLLALVASFVTLKTWASIAENRKSELELTRELDVTFRITPVAPLYAQPRVLDGKIVLKNTSLQNLLIKDVSLTLVLCSPSKQVVDKIEFQASIDRLSRLKQLFITEQKRLEALLEHLQRSHSTSPLEVLTIFAEPETEKEIQFDQFGQVQGLTANTEIPSDKALEKLKLFIEHGNRRIEEIQKEIDDWSKGKPSAFISISNGNGDFQFEELRSVVISKSIELPAKQNLETPFQIVEFDTDIHSPSSSFLYRLKIAYAKDSDSSDEIVVAECFSIDGLSESSCVPSPR